MRKLVQGMGLLNALFGIIVGTLAVVSPNSAAATFKVAVESAAMLGLVRMFGALLGSSGIISLLVARDPDAYPLLTRGYAAILILNVLGDLLVIQSGELQFAQIASGMMIELVLGVLLFAYNPATKN
jgi:hypothetical protein